MSSVQHDDDDWNMLVQTWKETNDHQARLKQRVVLIAALVNQNLQLAIHGGLLRQWGGRMAGVRQCERGRSSWTTDYFGEDPVYTLRQFRDRFRIPRALFLKIKDDLIRYNPGVWAQLKDCTGRVGQTAEVKMLVCLRYLATGRALDDFDDSFRMSKESVRRYTRQFCEDINFLYGREYLNRRPNRTELQQIFQSYTEAGFPGCLGCVDCTEVIWKNCPLQLKGQYHNKKDGKLAVIKAEAWADQDLYIWHWFVGRPGTSNDKTMMRFSPLFIDVFNRTYNIELDQEYRVTETGPARKLGYFLADRIYPLFPIFLCPIHQAVDDSQKIYTKRQEGRRKDVERAFGVIKARFKIVRAEDFRWSKNEIIGTTRACIILHNMLVRMNQAGHFVEDLAAEEADFDIISEMGRNETQQATWGEEQAAQRRTELEHATGGMTQQQLINEMMIFETEMTSEVAHDMLQAEFIEKFAEEHAAHTGTQNNT